MNTLWCIHRVSVVINCMGQLIYNKDCDKKEERKLKGNFSIQFGEHIRKVRKSKGLTQEELAHRANLHSTYIGHIETGTYTPSAFVVWKIAKVLNMELWELLKGF